VLTLERPLSISGIGDRGQGSDEHARERTERCVTKRAQELTRARRRRRRSFA